MHQEYRIGLYDESKNLIGYKADSFWSLSKVVFKPHGLANGTIPAHLLRNLASVLKIDEDKPDYSNVVGGLVKGLKQINKHRFFDNFETMLVGYSNPDDGLVTFTHRVFTDGIEELSPEEAAQLKACAEGHNSSLT